MHLHSLLSNQNIVKHRLHACHQDKQQQEAATQQSQFQLFPPSGNNDSRAGEHRLETQDTVILTGEGSRQVL